MSTNDKVTCLGECGFTDVNVVTGATENSEKHKKKARKVSFPSDEKLVTRFEPANPWQDVSATTRAQLAAEYLEYCRYHGTPPIDSVLHQIRELPENTIGGTTRAPRLALTDCSLVGTAPMDALEAVMRRVQFRRLELDHAELDDYGAEALFDMVEYYESTAALCIVGPRHFGIRGWQAAVRMIKKSSELTELEMSGSPLEAGHAPVLARSLRPASCRLRALCLQSAALSGEPLLCLVITLKSNSSVRELRLGDNRLTPSDAAQIGSLLRYNTRLQLLDLSNNQIQDSGFGHIADALEDQAAHSPASPSTFLPLSSRVGGYESRGLAFLVLWNNQLTRNCAHHLSKILRTSASLRVLNVGRNALGAEAARALAAERCGALASLGLQAARLPADGRAAAALLAARPALQRLDLRENKFSVSGLQTILAALKENTTLTQIDLDDAPELQIDTEPVGQLLQEIRSVCRRNEAATAAPDRLLRKISLTCHTAPMAASITSEEEPRSRLRSPAPSPAASPVPASRFNVIPVASHSPSPTTPTKAECSPMQSRFKVVQVPEPPLIKVQQAPRKASSRFSVTRNYDTIYNPVLPPTSPSPSPSPEIRCEDKVDDETKQKNYETIDDKSVELAKSGDAFVISDKKQEIIGDDLKVDKYVGRTTKKNDVGDVGSDKHEETGVYIGDEIKKMDKGDEIKKLDKGDEKIVKPEVSRRNFVVSKTVLIPRSDIRSVVTQTEEIMTDFNMEVFIGDEVKKMDEKKEVQPKKKVEQDDELKKKEANERVHKNIAESVIIELDKTNSDSKINENIDDMKTNMDLIISANTSDVKRHSDAKDSLNNEVKNSGEFSDSVKIDLIDSEDFGKSEVIDLGDDKIFTNVDTAVNSLTKVHNDQNVNNIGVKLVKEEAIEKNDLSKPELINNLVPAKDNVVLKKNKSESSLDSPDLEVSRLMRKPVSAFRDSSSSLEVSGSSIESLTETKRDTVDSSDVTPANLNVSISSNDSASPIIFGKKIHGSLSSLEASVSSVDSRQEKVMVASADSGIEYSLRNPSDNKDDSSNEGTLTCSSSLKSVKDSDTLTSAKRTSSLLDVPALKSKGLERMRKISWVAPTASFHLPKEEKLEYKLPSNLEKLLSLFQHPSSLFSRNSDEEKKSNSSTPPRKDSSLTSSFWSWGTVVEKNDKDDTDSLSEATDSTLSERVQVSFVDESFSRKLDSKTPSTDTENTLSEFQTFANDKVTDTTDDIVQNLDLSDVKTCDNVDLIEPNDTVYDPGECRVAELVKLDEKPDVRPRTFASVLKASGSENSLEKQSPETESVDKLPTKVIRGIKENISPENTLTKSLAIEMDKFNKWDVTSFESDKIDDKAQNDLAPIATIEETSDVAADDLIQLAYIDDAKEIDKKDEKQELGSVDLGKDALAYLMFENQTFESADKSPQGSLAQELRDAEIKEMLDLSPELIIDEAVEIPEIFTVEIKGRRSSPIIPERAKLKKSNSLEDLTKRPVLEKESPKLKTIAFKVPESTTPRDIPERRSKIRSRSGSSPKSLPESLNKPCPLTKMDLILSKKKKKVSSLGKIARDSLLALNMSEDEIAEFRRSYKLTSVESLRSLESVSEDANSQSGTSFDSRCKACLRNSQESLMSLDSITEDCKCDCEKRQNR